MKIKVWTIRICTKQIACFVKSALFVSDNEKCAIRSFNYSGEKDEENPTEEQAGEEKKTKRNIKLSFASQCCRGNKKELREEK